MRKLPVHGDTGAFLSESIQTDHVQGPHFTIGNLVVENKPVHTETVQWPSWPTGGAGKMTNERNSKNLINKAPRAPAVTAQQQAEMLPSPGHTHLVRRVSSVLTQGLARLWHGFWWNKWWRQLWAPLQAVLPWSKEPGYHCSPACSRCWLTFHRCSFLTYSF